MKVFELPVGVSLTQGTRISMEEEILEISQANQVAQNLAADLADADRSMDIVQALEDLAFVADTIREATPREAALIQIIGDTTVAGTGADADVVTPAMEDGESKPNRIRETIKRFVEAIKQMLATVVEKIKKFVQHLFKVSVNVQGRFDDLKKQLESSEFKDNGTINATYKLIPGYKYAEWDQLFKMIDEFTAQVNIFIDVQGQSLRGASSGVLHYLIAKNDQERLNALKTIEAATRVPTKLIPGLSRSAVPEQLGDNNAVQVQLGESKMMLGGINFSVSVVKYRIGDQTALTKSNRHLVIGADAATVDVVRNIGPSEEKQMKVPNRAQLERIMQSLAPLVEHVTNESSKDKLLGALATRADFHQRFSEEVLRRINDMEPTDENRLLASGLQQALTKLSVGSSAPYTVLLQTTQKIISLVSILVRESIEYRTKTE